MSAESGRKCQALPHSGFKRGSASQTFLTCLPAYHGNGYLMAWNVEKERVATFALSRFRPIAAMGQVFTRQADFSPKAYARQSFGIVGGEKPINVRLLFEPKLTVYITERQWHPSQEFRARTNGRVEMRMRRVLSIKSKDT